MKRLKRNKPEDQDPPETPTGGRSSLGPPAGRFVDSQHAEIKEGVKAGEQVIVHGQAGLPDGADISTEKPAAEKTAEPAEKR